MGTAIHHHYGEVVKSRRDTAGYVPVLSTEGSQQQGMKRKRCNHRYRSVREPESNREEGIAKHVK